VPTTVFGLTGGIASGKSTVAARLRARGVPVLDADELAREVVAPGSDGLAEVVARFGAAVLAGDGALDRKKLAAVAFASDEARRALERITHPRIAAATMERLGALGDAGEPLVAYEAALLVESGRAALFRPLVVVALDEAAQVARAMARDGATEAEVRARLAAQLPMAEKVAAADHVIANGGDRAALVARADEVLDAIARAAGVDPARYPRP
jgi:dephospho-CoA kinase